MRHNRKPSGNKVGESCVTLYRILRDDIIRRELSKKLLGKGKMKTPSSGRGPGGFMVNGMSTENLHPHLPYDKSLKEKARKLRSNPTPAEKRFWNTLRRMPFYRTVTFNRQKPLGNYIVDFYCHHFRLVVEIDGDSHGDDKNKFYDLRRTGYLESQGLKVLRFTNREVERNIEGVMARLEEILEKQKSKSPQPPSRRGSF